MCIFKMWPTHLEQTVVVDFLFIVTPIVGVCNCSMFCCTVVYVHSSIAIILMGKRELIDLLNFSPWCLVMVVWLFLAVPLCCLRFVIVVFPDHTHLLFLISKLYVKDTYMLNVYNPLLHLTAILLLSEQTWTRTTRWYQMPNIKTLWVVHR